MFDLKKRSSFVFPFVCRSRFINKIYNVRYRIKRICKQELKRWKGGGVKSKRVTIEDEH